MVDFIKTYSPVIEYDIKNLTSLLHFFNLEDHLKNSRNFVSSELSTGCIKGLVTSENILTRTLETVACLKIYLISVS
ncbi:hypothetical protein ACHAXS_013694 [Conticribra weissflogii]